MEKIIPTQVFQGETNECGLACIAMLAQTQGIDAPLENLRERYPASQHGTSLTTLCTILSELAIPAYPVIFDHGELAELPLPAILHYGASHYVLLAYRQGNYVCVMNPAIGQQLLPIDALKLEISGYALVLDSENQPDPQAQADKKRSTGFKALECMSLKETARMPGIYRLMVLAFLISLTLFIMPTMVGSAINQVYSSAGDADFPYFYFLLAFFVSTLLAFAVRWVTERFIKRFVVVNSVAGFSRLLGNSLNFFAKRAPGDVFSRFSNWQQASGIKIELDNGLRTDWIIGAIALGVMCYMSPLLAMVSGVGVTLMGLISVWAIYRDRYYTQQLQVKTAEQSDFILESIQGFSTIKSAGLDSQRKSVFARYALSLFTCQQQQRIYEQVKSSLYQLIGSLEMVFFMLLALPLLKKGVLTLGEFFAYSFVREIFTSYITKIFYAILQKNQLHVIDTRARDLFPAHSEHEAVPKTLPQFSSRLSFRHIVFAYDAQLPVLHDLSISLQPGQRIAIVGESGTGKSTLLKVMTGLMAPQQGEVVVDGQPVDYRQIHTLFFLQSQEDILFNASVLENITLFDENVDEHRHQRIKRSLEGLNLHSVVEKLPGGLNALIRESHAGLSLGQRQRLLLARAMYSNCPVLVLDEPTANLDENTAHQVMTTLLDHCREQHKTLITVTHSESVLSMFDRVYRMDNGGMAQVDTLFASQPDLTAAAYS
ncbi:Lactococcin-G-processing and transport ATP-binding protein LagD [Serratia fonticola]|uniref:Lactococcin-G-processing and transport ATP-binding protein LagD n=1 Tax=Serratia fonticola TaxID=47917 RepID=A0A3S4YQX7_SERFO|nr:ATP-binding cassette domain-containing protein [Serratia fonticola]CAI1598029.1 Lactococcin-G-processing and transport ATP-binding protein LagD [Serratia fonticola]VEI66395.1 Lactococcin-G-processing and transport ATP-binding protein LagD [Serratia fonticola]